MLTHAAPALLLAPLHRLDEAGKVTIGRAGFRQPESEQLEHVRHATPLLVDNIDPVVPRALRGAPGVVP